MSWVFTGLLKRARDFEREISFGTLTVLAKLSATSASVATLARAVVS
jgi:hypothetical protein